MPKLCQTSSVNGVWKNVFTGLSHFHPSRRNVLSGGVPGGDSSGAPTLRLQKSAWKSCASWKARMYSCE